ncbi:Thioredoxin domain-containing protein [Rhodopirellula sallentina SM41]|uniref:Thioredoxin domain-containing protein n=1 Tax=Rhodopirellula sallentina SM41 TaxID=1263870 RepID=M5U186_9BACT|nr:trypsin-like peptidase domain-containing protein [Rhodopirellula sallentina]EMI55197.1 Thioredoxin domain-containing protein [Rhodopirellula sallentina SM41]
MRFTPKISRATVASKWSALLLFVVAIGASGAVSADAILLEFSSANCPPCRAMQPIVSELIARGVPVRQVDVRSEPQLVQRYRIRSTPTYVILREGREVTRLVGAQTAAQLRQALQTSPSGKIVPTNSQIETPSRRAPSFADANRIQEPQTRLAPLNARPGSMNASGNRSFRREQGEDQWRSLESLTSAKTPSMGSNRDAMGRPQDDVVVEAMPSISLADAVERAQAATVRLRVYDGRGYGAGTGTIIDVHGEEALVLTCGHLFRDGEGKDKIEVDLFVGGEPHTVTGHLVDYDAGDRDIGLVAIRPGIPVQPVKVVTENDKMKVGQTAFSFGCDRGDPPSRRDTRITGVNKYNQNIGGSNLEISGAPIDGRSGGGLFDERGVLIGVCNAADYKSDVGIYTGPGSIHWQLDRVQLSRLYQADPNEALVADQVEPNQSSDPSAAVTESLPESNQFASNVASGANATGSTASEMIVILRDRDGNVREQVLTLRQPDAHLVRQIQQAARR